MIIIDSKLIIKTLNELEKLNPDEYPILATKMN